MDVVDTAAAAKAAKKAEKKLKKEKKAAAAAKEETPVSVGEDAVVAEKKDKKSKKRSREETVAAEEVKTTVTVNEEEADGREKKKKKKEKKDKKEKAADDTESAPAKAKSFAKSASQSWVYKQSPALSAVPQATIDAFYKDNAVEVTGDWDTASHRPILEFAQAGLPAQVEQHLSAFPKPTFIQSACWPALLSGRDMIGIASTGSGKTLAFGVPALIHVQNRAALEGTGKKGGKRLPQVLILSPTRELAMQIQEQMEKFGAAGGLKSIVLYGGVPKWEQKKLLQKGDVNIIVATPGRLIDLIEEDDATCNISDVSYFVLDEADRMLDLGFEEAIKKIISHLAKKNRQTVMFSATWPPAIQKIAEQYLTTAVKITVGSTDLSANNRIEQRVEVIDNFKKEQRLIELLKLYHNKQRTNRILIFALYKKEAARLEQMLRRNGYNIVGIHGDLSQAQRTAAIDAFRSGTTPLLIATDVAARGLDIPNVEYVINVTFPLTVEDYCHRIGRTGRAGATGISHTLFTVNDKGHSGGLINVLKQAGQKVPAELMKFGTTVKKKVDPNYGAFAKDIDMSVKGKKITFTADSDSE
ncbi:P-loop containing nucleoside triphosphate hydrolase protein [Fimicolochytrium jonesii]|uniref:P-loop containing nucleoside triphosphate hydrolase protein n=1 Tax=Fimicolochytrium jonesii TaxID=1396493 RepID=UPI0022FEB71C|nr:P-loop containing nucleoside triphosphate hydrolase protein [Fimicolochytrium jonesii]KAI8823770.1 P-loop containing nucleoside triphosphate hydrolase protein [Fimicolochytrium jonesii]